jgi:hypothetical protein
MPDTCTPNSHEFSVHEVEIHSVGNSQSESQIVQQNLLLLKW